MIDAAEHRGLVGSVARRLVAASDAVRAMGLDDAASAGMVALVRAAAKFRPELGYAFSSYAVVAIRRAILRAAAKHQRHAPLTFDVADDTADDDEEGERLRAVAGRVEAMLAALPPRERLVVEALHLRGKTRAEVAADLGRTGSRVGQLAKDAMRRLREAQGLAGPA